jgi:ribA/ribD-fused uncharacterized protein
VVSFVPKKDQLMTDASDFRTYTKDEVVFFRTTTGEFGPLSNMAPDFPILLQQVRVATAEALYQACRFPDYPDIQRLIIDQSSPMTAKMKSKKYRNKTRDDWDNVRVNIMRWCLRIKLDQNWKRFGYVLAKTGSRPIVEESTKDSFWGAKPNDNGLLVGANVLGRLLMELREQYHAVEAGNVASLRYPTIRDLVLLGGTMDPASERRDSSPEIQPSML